MDVALVDNLAINGRGWLHRRSAPAKLAMTGGLLAAAVVSRTPAQAGLVLLAVTGLGASERLPVGQVAGLAAFPALLAGLFALGWTGTTAVLAFLKGLSAASSMILVMTTTPYPQVFAALGAVLPGTLLDVLFLTYRGFFLLLGRIEALRRAVRLRGGYWRRALFRNSRGLAGALGVTVLHTWEMSETTYRVMALRGYRPGSLGGSRPRFSGWADLAPVAAGAAPLAAILLWGWWGG